MSSSLSPASGKGAAWLVEDVPAEGILTPEKATEEQRLIARTAEEFLEKEVIPRLGDLERKDWTVARTLMQRCGELGLIGVDVPEVYGGVQLDKATSLIVADRLASPASFGATFGGQANLSILPLLLFGTAGQKQQYLPRLVTGELIGAYALSEAASGSDALSARARATRLPDGSFVLNGEKLWITNGGFADLFIVFAKVDGEHFTAFIVERAFGGVSTGAEEHKMGLHGSSTTPLLLQDVAVPAANLLGEIGKGHKVAFNVLNYGRLKLGAMCSGGARRAIGEAARYARERRQFGQPIAGFGAIKHKLGEMTVRTYAIESLLFRTAGLIDDLIASTPHDPADGGPLLAALEEFAVEASIAKVSGSEALDYVLDENVQIHGGNGFVRDYPAEREFRDARVNRIFEGTNEINRLLIPTMLLRRASKGDPSLPAARRPGAQNPPEPAGEGQAAGRGAVRRLKQAAAGILEKAAGHFGDRLPDEQEILSLVADVVIDIYAAESAVIRAGEAARMGLADAGLHKSAAAVFVNDAGARVEQAGEQVLAACCTRETLPDEIERLRAVVGRVPINTLVLRRELADETTARGGYLFPLERRS